MKKLLMVILLMPLMVLASSISVSNATITASVVHLNADGRFFLDVQGPGVLRFNARGSSDGFYYCHEVTGYKGYWGTLQSQYVRNDEAFSEYTLNIPESGAYTILWATYAKGYCGVAEPWGEVSDITWNGEAVEYDACTTADGLVACYKFDGDMSDSSANGWHALHHTSIVDFTEDRHGASFSAVELDGEGCLYYAERGETNCVECATNFTFACWFKAEADTRLIDVSESGIRGTSSEIRYLIHSSFPIAVGRNGLNVFEHGDFHLPAIVKYECDLGESWHHIVMTVRNSAGNIFVDGRHIASLKCNTNYGAYISLGCWDNGSAQRYVGVGGFSYGGHFCGAVDDLRLYNRALSTVEVQSLYDGGGECQFGNVKWQNELLWKGDEGVMNAQNFLVNNSVIRVNPGGRIFLSVRGPGTLAFKARGSSDGFFYSYPGWELGGYVRDAVNYESRTVTWSGDANEWHEIGWFTYADGYLGTHAWGEITQITWNGVEVPIRDLINEDESDGKTYIVTYDAAGGTVSRAADEVAKGAAVGTLPTATRAGYEFLGWFTEEVGGSRVTAATVVTADVTFYAQWRDSGSVSGKVPVIESVTLSKTEIVAGESVTVTVVARSEAPVNWINSSLYGPKGNVYGGGRGCTWRDLGSGRWEYSWTDDFSAYAPGGTYRYARISCENEADEESEEWPDISFTVSNGHDYGAPVIESVTLSKTEIVAGESVTVTVVARSEAPVNWINSSLYGPKGNVYGGGRGCTWRDLGSGRWEYSWTDDFSAYAPGGTYRYARISCENEADEESEEWPDISFTVENGQSVPSTYGPWGEAEAVKNPDKLGPTMLTDMTLELNGAAGAVGDVVAAFRGDTGALCGLGKVMDESGTLSMVCYAPTGVKLHFKVWVSASGVENPVVVDCDAKSDLTAPTSGAFLSGHAIVVSDDKDLAVSLGSADWHTVSFNVLPEDPSPAAVFGSVQGKIAAVTQGIEFWMPGKSSSLKAIEIGKGYWVNTKVDDVEWTVSGKTDPKVEIALEEGWNLVGYAPEAEGAVQAVLKTALAAKAIDYVTYGVEFYPGGTLKKMEPGKAYWVHAKKAYTLVYDDGAAGVRALPLRAGALNAVATPTYGPWGESEAVKNPDKLGPTFLTDVAVEIDGEPAEEGDVVAVFRGDTGALCGLGKVMDDSGTLTVVCYAPKGVTLSFKVWLSESGVEEPLVVKCDNASKLVAPDVGAFYEGHAISGSTLAWTESVIVNKKVTIETGLKGCKVSGLPKGLAYDTKTGKITGTVTKVTATEGVVVKFSTSGAVVEELTLVVRKEVVSAGCEGLEDGVFPAGVVSAADGIPLQLVSETGVKSVKVTKLPAGMKYDSKKGVITGTPTTAGDYKVVLSVTTKSGAKTSVTIPVSVAAMPLMASGTFSGFVSVGEDNFGTFTLTATSAGKLTAKAVTAKGTYSFSKTGWDSVSEGVYSATLKSKKGDVLKLTLDSTLGWDKNQLWGSIVTAEIAATKKAAAVPSYSYGVSAQRRAFGKSWYFAAMGDAANGWTLAYAENAKAAALAVTLKADGSTAIAGALPGLLDAKGKALKVSASGYANVEGLKDGAIMADFAPIVTVNKVKKALAIRTNLWFDRSNDHESGVGEAKVVE